MMADQHMLADGSRISVTPAVLVSHRANSNPDIRSETPACHPAEKPEKSSVSKGFSGSVASWLPTLALWPVISRLDHQPILAPRFKV